MSSLKREVPSSAATPPTKEARKEPARADAPSVINGLPVAPKSKRPAGIDLYSDLPPPTQTQVKATQPASQRKVPADPSKVIFLDVDGVLRPAAPGGSATIFVDGDVVPFAGAGSDFLPSAMRALKWLVYETGARIILSTEWRRHEPLFLSVNNALRQQGLAECRQEDQTPMHAHLNTSQEHNGLIRDFAIRRVQEIDEWLGKHKEVKNWTAIDDIDLKLCKDLPKFVEDLKERFLLTDAQAGFTMGNSELCKKMLNLQK